MQSLEIETITTELLTFRRNRPRGVGGCPDGPSKQAVGQKINELLSKSCQLFTNFQKFPQIYEDFDQF